jgi:hypothetical protein
MKNDNGTERELRSEIEVLQLKVADLDGQLQTVSGQREADRSEARRVITSLNEEISARLSEHTFVAATVKSELETASKSQEAAHQAREKTYKWQLSEAEKKLAYSEKISNRRAQELDAATDRIGTLTALRDDANTLLRHFMDGIIEDARGPKSVILRHFGIGVKEARRKSSERLRLSGIFDAEWYSSANPDVGTSGADPAQHFIDFGYMEGRPPNARFAAAR